MMKKREPIITDTGDGPPEAAPEFWTYGTTDTGTYSHFSSDVGPSYYQIKVPIAVGKPPRGRAMTYDWPGALRYVIAKVAREGFPQGHGSQAVVERWLHEWFGESDLYVAVDTVRTQARLILEEIERVAKGR